MLRVRQQRTLRQPGSRTGGKEIGNETPCRCGSGFEFCRLREHAKHARHARFVRGDRTERPDPVSNNTTSRAYSEAIRRCDSRRSGVRRCQDRDDVRRAVACVGANRRRRPQHRAYRAALPTGHRRIDRRDAETRHSRVATIHRFPSARRSSAQDVTGCRDGRSVGSCALGLW